MLKQLFVAVVLAVGFWTLLGGSESPIEAQETSAIQTVMDQRVLGIVREHTDQILRESIRNGWTDVRVRALETNVRIASVVINDDLFLQYLEREIEAIGGDGAFAVEAMTGGHLERELRELGYEGQIPAYSMDTIRRTLADLRENGLSEFLWEAAEKMRNEGYHLNRGTMLPYAATSLPGIRQHHTCPDCERARADAEVAEAIALAVCVFGPTPACKVAAAIALWAWLHARAICEQC